MAKKAPRQIYRITFVCRKSNNTLTTVEEVKTPSFKCPLCKRTLLYLPEERRLTSHGEPKPGKDSKAPPPEHELRRVTEVGKV